MVSLPEVDTVTCTEAVGRLLWCGHSDGSVSVREPRSGVVVEVRQFRKGERLCVPTCLLNVDDCMWVGYSDGRIVVVDINTLGPISYTNAHVEAVTDIIQHSGYIFTCSDDTFIHKFSFIEGKPYKETSLEGHKGPVKALCCAGDVLVSAGLDQTAIIWSPTGSIIFSLSFLINKTQGYTSIKDKLHDLADQITELNLSEGSKHYHHLLPDILTVASPNSPSMTTRQNYRKAALQSQRRRLPGKPPLPHTPKAAKRVKPPVEATPVSTPSPVASKRAVAAKPRPKPKQKPKAKQVHHEQVHKAPQPQAHPRPHPQHPRREVEPVVTPPAPLRRDGGTPEPLPPPRPTVVSEELPMPVGMYREQYYAPRESPPMPVGPEQVYEQPTGYLVNLRTEPTRGEVIVSVDNDSEDEGYGFPRSNRPFRRGKRDAWMLQFRTEVRLARGAFLKWVEAVKAGDERWELAKLMEGVSNAGVLTGYWCKWRDWVGGPEGPDQEEEVVLPERDETDGRLCVVVDVGCLLDLGDGMTPYQGLTDFFNTCGEYDCELIVWLPDANEDLIVTLRRYDTTHVVSHCIIRANPTSTPHINRPFTKLLFIQPTTHPYPPIPNTLCVPPSSLRILSTLLVSLHQTNLTSIARALETVLQRPANPYHVLM